MSDPHKTRGAAYWLVWLGALALTSIWVRSVSPHGARRGAGQLQPAFPTGVAAVTSSHQTIATDHVHDTAPGEEPADSLQAITGLRSYAIGLGLAALLTIASFLLPGSGLIWEPAIPVALIVLAVAQMGIHLVFFLHVTTGPDNTNNVMALAFGILIVLLLIGGSLWIMAHLNANMMPMGQMMDMQR